MMRRVPALKPLQQSAALLVCLALCSACSALSTLHTARPVPVGTTEGAFAMGTYAFVDDDGDRETLVSMEGAARHGFTPWFDGGLKVSSLTMLQVDANFAFYQGERFAVSLDPTAAVMPVAGIYVTYLWLPLLVDVVASDDLTFVLSVKPGYVRVDELDDEDFGIDETGSLLGFGLGLKIATGDIHLMPEFNVVYPDEDVADAKIYSVSLGVIF